MKTVLIVDDDPTVAEVVAGYLSRAGFAVERAADGPTAVARSAAHRPDLVVLDLMLPGMDGLEVCRRLRDGGPLPVIMLTARGDEEDRILGLEVGADDYVTKPFSPRELVLRVEAVLRRAGAVASAADPAATAEPWLRAGTLALDPAARRAARDGAELALTIREFDLLAFFLRHPGRVVGREELMRRVWGWEFGDLSTVTVHVRRLREKIEDDPARPRLISTVWGVGYRFDPPATAEPPTSPVRTGRLGPVGGVAPARPGRPGDVRPAGEGGEVRDATRPVRPAPPATGAGDAETGKVGGEAGTGVVGTGVVGIGEAGTGEAGTREVGTGKMGTGEIGIAQAGGVNEAAGAETGRFGAGEPIEAAQRPTSPTSPTRLVSPPSPVNPSTRGPHHDE